MSPDARPPTSQLSVARLEKRYKARTVVHDVSLDVASGEVVGLLGPNGAGKVGSSRVDLQACKLEYSIVSPK